jgi:hypothetical protein
MHNFHLFSTLDEHACPISKVFWNTVTYLRAKCCRHIEEAGCLQLHRLCTRYNSFLSKCLESENEMPKKCRRKASYPRRFQTPSIATRQPPIFVKYGTGLNRLNAELNPVFHLLALLRAHHILRVSRIRVKTTIYHIIANTHTSILQHSRSRSP